MLCKFLISFLLLFFGQIALKLVRLGVSNELQPDLSAQHAVVSEEKTIDDSAPTIVDDQVETKLEGDSNKQADDELPAGSNQVESSPLSNPSALDNNDVQVLYYCINHFTIFC